MSEWPDEFFVDGISYSRMRYLHGDLDDGILPFNDAPMFWLKEDHVYDGARCYRCLGYSRTYRWDHL